jgi:hypothetical protein
MTKIDNKHPVTFFRPPIFNANQPSFLKHFKEEGFVVINKCIIQNKFQAVINLIRSIQKENIVGAKRLGFLDVYHDDALAQLRQDRMVLEPFQKIFKNQQLWVIFDRLIQIDAGEILPSLPAHIDQNMIQNPTFCNVQGMIALSNMNVESGTIALVPRSHLNSDIYKQWTKENDGFINYQGEPLNFKAIELKMGEILIWDSRLTHSRYDHNTTKERLAMLISYAPAIDNEKLRSLRNEVYQSGIGLNDHAAGLRATAKPRYEKSLRIANEQLTDLGKKLYGITSWFKE